MAIQFYLQDHNDTFPAAWHGFRETFGQERIEPRILECSVTGKGRIGYGFNGYLLGKKCDFQKSFDVLLTADAVMGDRLIFKLTDIDRKRHTDQKSSNYYASFLDGHVKAYDVMHVLPIKPDIESHSP